jgi:hypothetical protein
VPPKKIQIIWKKCVSIKNIEDVCDTIRRPNLPIMGIEECKNVQAKGIKNIH